MGAAAWERAATADEVARMCRLLDEALRHGAIGLSVNHFDKDRTLRLVPGYFADDAEYRALFDVVARHPGRTVQVITRFNDPDHDVERRRALRPAVSARRRARPVARRADECSRRATSATRRGSSTTDCAAEGVDFWPNVVVQAARAVLRLRAVDRVPAGPGVERDGQRTRTTPSWRRSPTRRGAPGPATSGTTDRTSPRRASTGPTVADLRHLRDRRRTARHLARRVRRADAACTSPTRSPSGCLRNGIGSSLVGTPDALDEDDVVALLREPQHAHQHQRQRRAPAAVLRCRPERATCCTHYVRDTGQLVDRGGGPRAHRPHGVVLRAHRPRPRSRRARSATSPCSPSTRSSCARRRGCTTCPLGSWRFTRPPAGFRATVVRRHADVARRQRHRRAPGDCRLAVHEVTRVASTAPSQRLLWRQGEERPWLMSGSSEASLRRC